MLLDNVELNGNDKDLYTGAWKDIRNSLIVDFMPYAGDGKGLIEAVRGKDLINDDELSILERGLGLICLSEIKSVSKAFKLVGKLKK